MVDDIEWTAVQLPPMRTGLSQSATRPRTRSAGTTRRTTTAGDARSSSAIGGWPRYVPREGTRLLDVGTARGDFLVVMREQGWEVTGIEPFAQAGNPHDLPIHRFDFPAECDLPSDSYDVITAWAVFEHLRDPDTAFRECARMLAPGGRLIVQVPNLRSIWSRWALQEDIPAAPALLQPADAARVRRSPRPEARTASPTRRTSSAAAAGGCSGSG